jgi:hypothetical protein
VALDNEPSRNASANALRARALGAIHNLALGLGLARQFAVDERLGQNASHCITLANEAAAFAREIPPEAYNQGQGACLLPG